MNEILQKINDYPRLMVLGVGWAKLTTRCRHKLINKNAENYSMRNASLLGTPLGLLTMLEKDEEEEGIVTQQ
jgi:hypothetical protein